MSILARATSCQKALIDVGRLVDTPSLSILIRESDVLSTKPSTTKSKRTSRQKPTQRTRQHARLKRASRNTGSRKTLKVSTDFRASPLLRALGSIQTATA